MLVDRSAGATEFDTLTSIDWLAAIRAKRSAAEKAPCGRRRLGIGGVDLGHPLKRNLPVEGKVKELPAGSHDHESLSGQFALFGRDYESERSNTAICQTHPRRCRTGCKPADSAIARIRCGS